MSDEISVATLVQAYENGLYSAGEVFAKLLELSDTISLDELTADLPTPLRERFVQSMRDLYDNDLPAATFKNFHDAGHMPADRLATLRAWLSRPPERSP